MASPAAILVEAVEPRILFATIQVTTLADENDPADGVTSLREALTQAASLAGPDSINFADGLTGDILLDPGLGSLVADSDVDIAGPGAASLSLKRDSAATTNFRILRVGAGRTVTVSGLTVTGGVADESGPGAGTGGGVLNDGNLTLTDCVVSSNRARDDVDSRGGGIANDSTGSLTLLRCTVEGNAAGNNATQTTAASGGGVFSLGALTVTSSTFAGNSASGFVSAGGGIAAAGGSLSLSATDFTGNSATGGPSGAGSGGGVYAGVGGFVMTGGTFSGNGATGGAVTGGGLDAEGAGGQVSGTTFSGNGVTGFSGGGGGLANGGTLNVTGATVQNGRATGLDAAGIYNDSGATLSLTACTVADNSQFGNGAGLLNAGDATITDCWFSGNADIHSSSAFYTGGAIDNLKTLTVLRSTFSYNSAAAGAAVYNAAQGTARLYNSTFYGNSTAQATGGSGAGVFSAGSLTSINCTFNGNTAAPDGTGAAVYRSAGTATLHNTLAAGNTRGSGASAVPDDVTGSIDPASSHNLIGNGDRVAGLQTGLNGNAMGTTAAPIDAKLGPLVMNGGPAPTIALLPGSPALNVGDNARAVDAAGVALATDQRGAAFARVVDTTVDVGAYEAQTNSPLPRPHDVTATPDSVSGSVFVDWASEPEPDFAYYNLYRSAAPGGPYLPLANHLTASEYVDGAVSPGTTYYYVVTNVDAAGTESPQSLESVWRGGVQLIVSTAVDEDDGNVSPGDLSLREAVRLAEAQSDPGQVITFAPGLAGQPINISDTLGTLNLSRGLSIQGLGGGQTVLNASGKFRVLQVDAGNSAAVSGLVIAGPDPASAVTGVGGGVFNAGTLTLTDCTIRGFYVQGTSTAGGGAAINNSGTLTMTGGTLDRDRSLQSGGAIYSNAAGAALTLNGVTISNNNGRASGGAILVGGTNATLTMTGCTLQNNATIGGASFVGGGAVSSSSATVRATDCRFIGNQCGSSTGTSAGGGAIFASGSTTLTGCTFSGNTAPSSGGGAVFVQSTGVSLVANGCTFDGNSALASGAVSCSSNKLRLVNCTFSGNAATASGGGLFAGSSDIAIANCTFFGNSAATDGGGIAVSVAGSPTIVFTNLTVTANRADSDGNGTGSGGGIAGGQGSVLLHNCVVAGNVRGAAAGTSAPSDLGGGSIFPRSSVIGDGSGNVGPDGTFGNRVGTAANPLDPKLGPLSNNGGPTLTCAPLSGSPAIDLGDNTFIAADFADLDGDGNTTEPVPYDQRGAGFARVAGLRVDAGALETVPPSVTAVAVNDGAAQRSRVTSLTVTFDRAVAVDAGAFAVVGRDGAGAGTVVTAANPSGDGRTWLLIFGGSSTDGGSLPDGVYDLTVSAAKVHAGAADGPGMAADYRTAFHRLFGDGDGNGTVNALDYARFKQAFGTSGGAAGYNAALDFDGNGTINALDYAQFKKRFGVTFTY